LTDAFIIVLTTWPAGADRPPRELARTLVEERLAACVNVLPAMDSTFRWQGKVDEAREHQIVIKTSVAVLNELKARIAALHPYDVPELLVLTIADGADDYLNWIGKSVQR